MKLSKIMPGNITPDRHSRISGKGLARRLGVLFSVGLLLFTMSGNVWAQSPQDEIYESGSQPSTSTQLESYADDTAWYDPTAGECAPIAGGDVGSNTQNQDDNARVVIGVAKTLGLGQEGALIGLMTALTESGLRNYANTGVPVSMENPAWLALPEPRPLGNDHDSVGIMQQRTSTGWSTYGNGGSRDVVWQLMDPVYAAQAFFGTPRNATLPEGLNQPSAVKKGLINLGSSDDAWRDLDPWIAAQRVQISAFADGSNYRSNMARAQSLLSRLWSESSPVPLRISLTGVQSEGGNDGTVCPTLSGDAQQRILQTIALYAWPQYRPQGSAGALTAKEEYRDAIRAARAGCNPRLREGNPGETRCEYIGDTCGVNIFTSDQVGADCGGFTTRVMRDSGVDPDYNTNPESNTTGGQWPYLRRETSKYQEVSPSDLQPGDIAINDGHTYFYVGDAMKDLVPGWEGATASASQCGRTAMAGPEDNRNSYSWYRFVGSSDEVFEVDARDKIGGSNDQLAERATDKFPSLTKWSLTGRSRLTL